MAVSLIREVDVELGGESRGDRRAVLLIKSRSSIYDLPRPQRKCAVKKQPRVFAQFEFETFPRLCDAVALLAIRFEMPLLRVVEPIAQKIWTKVFRRPGQSLSVI